MGGGPRSCSDKTKPVREGEGRGRDDGEGGVDEGYSMIQWTESGLQVRSGVSVTYLVL